MTTKTTSTGPYTFYEIFLNQITMWMRYVIDSLTNSIFEVLHQCCTIGKNLSPMKEAARCQIGKLSVDNCDHLFER